MPPQNRPPIVKSPRRIWTEPEAGPPSQDPRKRDSERATPAVACAWVSARTSAMTEQSLASSRAPIAPPTKPVMPVTRTTASFTRATVEERSSPEARMAFGDERFPPPRSCLRPKRRGPRARTPAPAPLVHPSPAVRRFVRTTWVACSVEACSVHV